MRKEGMGTSGTNSSGKQCSATGSRTVQLFRAWDGEVAPSGLERRNWRRAWGSLIQKPSNVPGRIVQKLHRKGGSCPDVQKSEKKSWHNWGGGNKG